MQAVAQTVLVGHEQPIEVSWGQAHAAAVYLSPQVSPYRTVAKWQDMLRQRWMKLSMLPMTIPLWTRSGRSGTREGTGMASAVGAGSFLASHEGQCWDSAGTVLGQCWDNAGTRQCWTG
jgi:hypothetical protein